MPTCLSCGSTEPEGKRFCGECGARLDAASVEAGRERKVVTVLFCDLVGFTSASDGADPEEVQARLSPFHARCRDAIEHFGGTVEKFIGDAVMAAFGAPTVHEDDPHRAVRAGLALLDAVEELNAERGLGLSVRIGVATGEAVVSLGAQPSQGEGMLAGDVVNTAARLQAAAPVGRILVGEHTYAATKALIEYEPHDPIVAKGKAEPIPVWVAVGSRGSVGEDLADRSRPMIGREDELAQLQRAFSRAVRESSVQLVTIVAEPGLGKSRLIQAFGDWVDDQEELVRWRQGKCPPYGDAVAYAALSDVVKAQAGILDSDDAASLRRKLDDTVRALVDQVDLAEQASWLTARLTPLVGLPASEASQEELFTAWRRFLEALAAAGPFIVVVEDLQWADNATLDFLTHVLEWTVGVPMMILTAARPELYDKAPTWAAGHRNAMTLSLAPLDDLETAHLFTSLLGTRVLPAELHAALLAKAAGNPLYAREYLAILTDQPEEDLNEILVTEMAQTLPGSVQAVIAARLDTLPTESKHLLQAAAVIGHTFWSGAVACLTTTDDAAVRARLHDLVRRDYLRPARTSRIAGEDEYTFGHALIADVAFSQLPRPDRARHHQASAEWHAARIAKTDSAPDTSPDSPVVAHHYTQAYELARDATGNDDPLFSMEERAASAATWHAHAAEYSRPTEPHTALTHATRAVEFTPSGDPARARRLILLGEISVDVDQMGQADQLFDQAQQAASAHGDEITAAYAQVLRHGSLRNMRAARSPALLEDAIAVLERHDPGAELVSAYLERAYSGVESGRASAAAIADSDLAIEMLDQLDDAPVELRIQAFTMRGRVSIWVGDPLAEESFNEALALASAHSVSSALIDLNDGLATWKFFNGDARGAVTDSEAAVRTAELTGRRSVYAHTSGNLAETLVVVGDPRAAVELCEKAATGGLVPEDIQDWMTLWTYWAWAQVVRGDLAGAEATLARAFPSTDDDNDLAGLLLVAVERQWADSRRQADDEHAAALLEFLRNPARHELFRQYLSRVARLLAAHGELDLLGRMIEDTPTDMVFYANNVLSARATLAQGREEYSEALTLHAAAGAAWAAYGYPLEQAHALIGAAQCRVALGQPARAQLEEASDVLERIGAGPLLAETERLLAETAE